MAPYDSKITPREDELAKPFETVHVYLEKENVATREDEVAKSVETVEVHLEKENIATIYN